MKANRKFVDADEAVSPVIAVILMVAITVVLAATVFVLVSDIGSQTQTTQPAVSWTMDEIADRWEIAQAPNQVAWAGYSVKASGTTSAWVRLNGDSAAAAPSVGPFSATTAVELGTGSFSGANLAAGDFTDFCVSAGATQNVQITLTHIASNSIANQKTFASIAQCV